MNKANEPAIDQAIASIFELFVEVSITHTLSTNAFTQVLPHGMNMSQFKLLTHYSRTNNTPTSIVDLARIFQVTKPSMGETVNKLKEKSFVKIQANPLDHREKLVSITAKGEAARLDAIHAFAPFMQKMISDIGSKQFEDAAHMLRPIRAWLDEQRDHPGSCSAKEG